MAEPRYQKHRYCSYCGHPFEPDQPWPRRCRHCQNITFQNPIPVTIVLQPVDDGVLVVRRAIEPQADALALPGGYIDLGESWQEAGTRELYEEACVTIDPQSLRVMHVFSAPDGTLIIAALAPRLAARDLPPFTPSLEASERRVIDRPVALAWPLHTELVETYFASQHRE
jgi:ADP-ribose pyrophosphatase YjhB (NUDIX family)